MKYRFSTKVVYLYQILISPDYNIKLDVSPEISKEYNECFIISFSRIDDSIDNMDVLLKFKVYSFNFFIMSINKCGFYDKSKRIYL
ncbi:hypothetical protein POCGH01_00159600 [Plasmodium ovale]|uniref:Uncharacterized protein n=1 Tax=Plasmodium ovale TaxID=36330 RepID=A0A1D3JE75_PLAOA|nr:hypothetical protein POCGH01_00159600 [Plasmodium ovale]